MIKQWFANKFDLKDEIEWRKFEFKVLFFTAIIGFFVHLMIDKYHFRIHLNKYGKYTVGTTNSYAPHAPQDRVGSSYIRYSYFVKGKIYFDRVPAPGLFSDVNKYLVKVKGGKYTVLYDPLNPKVNTIFLDKPVKDSM